MPPRSSTALAKIEPPSPDLVVLERCRAELEKITDLPSVLNIRDRLVAIQTYMKARGEAMSSQNTAASIVAMAEARAGQLIEKGQEDGTFIPAGGGRPKKPSQGEKVSAAVPVSAAGVSTSVANRYALAAEVLDKDPGWFDEYKKKCDAEDVNFTQNAVYRRARELRREDIGTETPPLPEGVYDVVVIDPPWPTDRRDRRASPGNSGFDYPTMSEEELTDLEIPFADDCHAWVWTTQGFLPMCLRVGAAWGLKYVCTFVWVKTKGMKPIGLPYFNCEFAVYFRKGSPTFSSEKGLRTANEWPSGGHSEKPEEFYGMVRRTTKGKRLDVFNRRPIKGFETWGNEKKDPPTEAEGS